MRACRYCYSLSALSPVAFTSVAFERQYNQTGIMKSSGSELISEELQGIIMLIISDV
jgi:hypothetical protein